jgi:hypothetical protein
MKGTLKLAALTFALLGGAAGTLYAQMCEDSHDGMKTKPCWEVNLLWSLRDTGPVEGDVQEKWQWINGQWPGTHLLACHTRACAMRKAVEAAKNGFAEEAFHIARACQHHNKGAEDSISAAGIGTIAEYLRKQP